MRARTVHIVVFPGFELLDLSGPASVFSTASTLLGREAYRVVAVSHEGGMVESSAGIRIEAKAASTVRVGHNTTVLVSGGTRPALARAAENTRLIA